MDIKQRKVWNENHKILTNIILKPINHSQSVQLFLSQHSLLHSSSINQDNQATLEDKLLEALDETAFRMYPVSNPDTKNSIAWHLWHIARIEDITMNILIANREQVLSGNWLNKMNVPFNHSGNDMTEKDIALLSSRIDFHSLLAYRKAVGKRTREVISSLLPGQLSDKIDPTRMERLFEENAVSQNSRWLADYWSNKSIAGLILMPATRHNFLHLNKCIRIKDKLNRKGKKGVPHK